MQLILILVFSFVCITPAFAYQFGIDSPLGGSLQSGVVAPPNGWKCPRTGEITARIDGGAEIAFVEDLPRGDTAEICNNSGDNGFGTLPWNWNVVGDGSHTIEFFDAGQKFAEFDFTVMTFGTEFLFGPSASFHVKDFPDPGTDVEVSWDAAIQNFRITGELLPDTPPLRATPMLGVWDFTWEIVNTFTETYTLHLLTTETGPELAVGIDASAHLVTAGAIQAISPGNPLPYDFAVLVVRPVLCELHLVYWLEPEFVAGMHVSVVTEENGDECGSSLGDAYEVLGVRTSALFTGQPVPTLEQVRKKKALQDVHKTQPSFASGVAKLLADFRALKIGSAFDG